MEINDHQLDLNCKRQCNTGFSFKNITWNVFPSLLLSQLMILTWLAPSLISLPTPTPSSPRAQQSPSLLILLLLLLQLQLLHLYYNPTKLFALSLWSLWILSADLGQFLVQGKEGGGGGGGG